MSPHRRAPKMFAAAALAWLVAIAPGLFFSGQQ